MRRAEISPAVEMWLYLSPSISYYYFHFPFSSPKINLLYTYTCILFIIDSNIMTLIFSPFLFLSFYLSQTLQP